MDNSLSSDKEEKKIKDLTADQVNNLQILVNKLWNLRIFSTGFNGSMTTFFNDFEYVLKNLNTDIDFISYFTKMKGLTDEFKTALSNGDGKLEGEISDLLDILNNFQIHTTWDNEYIKANVKVKEYPIEVLEYVNNYLLNISNFNLPCLVASRDPNMFIQSVLGSEPVYLHYNKDQEKSLSDTFLSQFNELQQSRFRLYTDFSELPIGSIANIIAWDYVHLMDNTRFKEGPLNQLYGVLRPGGVITLNYPSIYDVLDLNAMVRHLYGVYDPSSIEKMFREVGFEIIKNDITNQILYAKKPGILNTNKASPTISTIVNIDSLFDKK